MPLRTDHPCSQDSPHARIQNLQNRLNAHVNVQYGGTLEDLITDLTAISNYDGTPTHALDLVQAKLRPLLAEPNRTY